MLYIQWPRGVILKTQVSLYLLFLLELQICNKKRLKKFWSYQRNRAPSAKGLSQTPFLRFWIRASPVIESFWLKLKTIILCFEHDISHKILNDNVYGQVYSYKYCRLLTKQKSLTDFLLGIISPPKISRNCPWWSLFLYIKQGYGVKSRTLLNSITDDLMRVFWKSCTKNFGKLSEKNSEVPFY